MSTYTILFLWRQAIPIISNKIELTILNNQFSFFPSTCLLYHRYFHMERRRLSSINEEKDVKTKGKCSSSVIMHKGCSTRVNISITISVKMMTVCNIITQGIFPRENGVSVSVVRVSKTQMTHTLRCQVHQNHTNQRSGNTTSSS